MIKIAIVQNKDKALQPMMKVKREHLEKIREVLPDAEIDVYDDINDEIVQKVKDADILLMDPLHLHHPIFKDTKNLKWVHSETAGINTLPESILDSNIIITNSSGVHPIPIAEHVFGMMLMFERRLNKAMRAQLIEKKWIRDDRYFDVGELHGKRIGIAGLGKIGGKIAQLSRAFGMKVDATVRSSTSRRLYIDRLFKNSELKEMVKECDYVINCLPATSETKGIFNQEIFSNMKKNAYYISIGRGITTVEKDLITALEQKTIAGAGLDVFEKEPLPGDSPLWNLENVIITPHYSGWTPYYMDRVIEIFCYNLKAYLSGESLPNEVDKKLGY